MAANDLQLAFFNPSVFFALPIVCLAFLNQTNVHGIVSELENPTPARQKTLIVSSTALTMCFYLVTGAAGYIRFGNATQDNILLGYVHQSRSETLAFAVARMGMVVCLVSSMALVMYPCR